MKWYLDLKIGKRLILTFGIIIILVAVLGIYSYYSLSEIHKKAEEINDSWLPRLNYSRALDTMTSDYRNLEFQHVISENKVQMADIEKEMDSQNSEIYDTFNKYVSSSFEEDKMLFNTAKSQWAKYIEVHEKVIELSTGLKTDEAMKLLMGEGKTAFDNATSAFGGLVKFNQSNSAQVTAESKKLYDFAAISLLISILGVIAISIFVSFLIKNSIAKPVSKLKAAADLLAVGDITANVEAIYEDEIGELMKSFEKMIDNIRAQALAVEKIANGDLTLQIEVKSEKDLLGKKLTELIESNNEVLSNIRASSDQVAAGANQISESAQALSQGSTEQASTVEELTASLEQISVQTKQNAINADQANELAMVAKDAASQGNLQMNNMLRAMNEINESSSNISKIIKVIDEIAFQTNILALNAAVEAARAGQHGKGFAVVAEEVRNLAARSADAAKETTVMIEGSIKKVDAGTKIANETADALSRIVEDVTKASSLVRNIAVASNEQASGIAQISQGISQVSAVVQTNSATAEESASASEELTSQAELLKQQVSGFKLRKDNNFYGDLKDLNPELLKLLDNVKKKTDTKPSGEPGKKLAQTALSSKEFGKY